MKHSQGWTLIELIFTCAISAILIGAAAPSFHLILKNSQMSSDLNSLIALAKHARQNAIRLQSTVIVCPSLDQEKCEGRDWTKRLMLFTDLNNNRKRDENEQLLHAPTISTSNKILWKGSGRATYLRYNRLGRGITFGSFYVCSKTDSPLVRRLAISRIGRTLIHPDTDRDGMSDSVTNALEACS